MADVPDATVEESTCAVCGKGVMAGRPLGNIDGKPAHIDCWRQRRAES